MYNFKLFVLSSPMCPNILLLLWQCFLFLLASVLCWNFYIENLDFHKELHSYRRKFFSGASKLMLRGPEAYSWPSEMFTDKTLGFYAHCLVHRWVKFLLGLLTYGAGSHKGTFCPWMNTKLLLLRREMMKDAFFSHIADITPTLHPFIDVSSIYFRSNY